MAVQLTVIGSSPAWPNPGGACSGYVVDGRLLLDCGPGVLAKLRRREAWPSVEAIAITHLHLDHWGDLIPWVWGRLFGPGETRPALWLPPGSSEELRPILHRLGNEDMLERAFDVSEYEPRRAFTVAGLEVTAVPVVHYNIDAYGFRVQDDRVLAYSGDTGPCDGLVELSRDADLLLCEATLERGELDGDMRGHLSADEALDAYRDSGARRLLLTHRPKELPLDSGLEQAYDGLVVDV